MFGQSNTNCSVFGHVQLLDVKVLTGSCLKSVDDCPYVWSYTQHREWFLDYTAPNCEVVAFDFGNEWHEEKRQNEYIELFVSPVLKWHHYTAKI